MKILLISSLYGPYAVGGAERVVKNLAEGMVDRGHEVHVVTTTPDGKERTEVLDGVNVEFISSRNIYRPFDSRAQPSSLKKFLFHAMDSWNPAMATIVGSRVSSLGPDVVNSHNITGFSPAIFPAIRKNCPRLVHTLHDQYLLCPRTTMYRTRNCVRQCATCKPFSKVRSRLANMDLVIGVSDFLIRRHAEFGVLASINARVIRNPAPERSRPTASRTWNGLRIGYLGQIRQPKGLHVLIDAFLSEQKNLDDVELHIGGRGDSAYEAHLRQMTALNTSVKWSGYVDSQEFLDSIDVLVVPSLLHDSAPLVITEAFAASRPVIASRTGGSPEFISPDTGWTFDPTQPMELRALLRKCRDNQAILSIMGEKARAVAAAQNKERFLDEYQDAFFPPADEPKVA